MSYTPFTLHIDLLFFLLLWFTLGGHENEGDSLSASAIDLAASSPLPAAPSSLSVVDIRSTKPDVYALCPLGALLHLPVDDCDHTASIYSSGSKWDAPCQLCAWETFVIKLNALRFSPSRLQAKYGSSIYSHRSIQRLFTTATTVTVTVTTTSKILFGDIVYVFTYGLRPRNFDGQCLPVVHSNSELFGQSVSSTTWPLLSAILLMSLSTRRPIAFPLNMPLQVVRCHLRNNRKHVME